MLRGLIAVCLCWACLALAQAPLLDAKAPYTFTDQPVRLPVTATGELALTVKTITVAGWGPSAEVKATVTDGSVTVTPLTEGLHVVTCAALPQFEARFLALAPPPPVAEGAVPAWLMQQPLTLLSMGDSVTATGDYETLLAMLLRRATGNPAIVTAERAYSGRSVDASVRNFDDALATRPAAAFIMYGLNDQGAGCSLRGYVEQTRWLAKRLRDEAGTRVFLLSPTPDLSRPKDVTDYGPYLFRTLGYAAALPAAAHDTGAVCVDTFQALWGQGGADLNAAARAMWPLYPRSYRQQLTSVLETDGQGDGVHPNALGHLQFAKAIYRAMLGQPEPPAPLTYVATSGVINDIMTTTVTCTNVSGQPRAGTLTFYPMPDGELTCADDPRYDLAPGASRTFTLTWPAHKQPGMFTVHPYRIYRMAGTVPPFACSLLFHAWDSAGGARRISAVYAPQGSPCWLVLPERMALTKATVNRYTDPLSTTPHAYQLDEKHDVGRITTSGGTSPVRGVMCVYTYDLSYCRLGAALSGDPWASRNRRGGRAARKTTAPRPRTATCAGP
jgi:lysophospholipase L1-like esterase